MQFEISKENSLHCFISAEELKELNIELEDFLKDRSVAFELMEKILKEAKEEIGYEGGGVAMNMQIAPRPAGGVEIIINDFSKDSVEGIMDNIFKHVENGETAETEKDMEDSSAVEAQIQNESGEILIAFPKLEEAISYASFVNGETVHGSLYKNEQEGEFYIIATVDETEKEEFFKISANAMEFANFRFMEARTTNYIKEHMNCILAQDAIAILKQF